MKLLVVLTILAVIISCASMFYFFGQSAQAVEGTRNVKREVPVETEEFNFEDRIKSIRVEEELPTVEKVIVPVIKRSPRKIHRYTWESSADIRAKIWNIPEEDQLDSTLTAFLRVCIAEADGNTSDCIGIWQVIRNNRRRTCARAQPGGKRITECDENGETFLSALRRHQRHILGYIPLRNRRATWISKMTLDCETPPEEYPDNLNQWDAQYFNRCTQTIALGQRLMKGKLPPSTPGHRYSWLPGRPITWGGRCESKKASCDDRIACARGLVRIPDTNTYNAFWQRARTPDEIDPICAKLGYGVVPEQSNKVK